MTQGRFSFYAELDGKNGQVTGYVKPLFKDVKAADADKDRDKTFTQKLYARLVDIAAKVLKNFPRREVATKIDVSGEIDQPQTRMLQAIGNLLRNAFVKAILPGFDRATSSSTEKAAIDKAKADTSTDEKATAAKPKVEPSTAEKSKP